jgi:glucosamine--fructose-6-phosphate aminotransferase (isomerizing)
MCGIVGYLGNADYKEYILSGLKLLQNRGYDSVGICSNYKNSLQITKYASINTHDSLKKLEDSINELQNNSSCAIGHTRWATHGGKTDINAHPHSDNKQRIAIVHNGIIENFQEIKMKLINKGYFFKSQTDTEVVAVLIGYHLDNNETIGQSIKNTVEELRGTWAIVLIHREYDNKLWITRNGSPLLLGMDDEFIMVVSEQIAFNNYIKKYIVLDNNDLIEITKKETITYTENINRYNIQRINNDTHIELIPSGYCHWMLKEIMEQPDAIIRAINNGGRIESNSSVKLGGLEQNKNVLMKLNHIIILGCGTSYHSGLWASDIFKKLNIFETVTVYDGAEFNVKDIPKSGETGIILLSQSGETKDLHRCIQIAKNNNLLTIGIVNVIDSLIARESSCGVYLNAGREVAVASSKSFTNQCIVLTLVAIWFSQNRNTCLETRIQIVNDLHYVSLQIQNITSNTKSIISIVDNIKNSSTIFLLGKGKEEAIAKEGALKLKEIAYIHAEGYSSSALKHGPFALIEDNTPIIIIDVDDDHRDKNRNAYEEIKARNAYIIRISDIGGELEIERNKTFGGLLANVYIQLISYYIALEKGNNPDYPRNLAKVVTVE